RWPGPSWWICAISTVPRTWLPTALFMKVSGGRLNRNCDAILTSPRLRGEVGAEAPGEGDSPRTHIFRICGGGPSPQPSPREGRGEGAIERNRITFAHFR